MVFAIYALLIFEGAIRKWLFPFAGEVLFFVRVPVALAVYAFVCFDSSLWRVKRWPLNIGLGLGFVAIPLACIQLIVGDYPVTHVIVVAYGWMNYFFYIPLVLIIGHYADRMCLLRFFDFTALLSVLCVPLVITQYFSPPDSFLVVGFGQTEDQQFAGLGFGGEAIRPMGLFTSSLGQQMFVASSFAFSLFYFLGDTGRTRARDALAALALLSVTLMAGFSGQRGLMVHLGVVLLFSLIGVVGVRKGVGRKLLLPACFISCFVLGFLFFFPNVFDDFANRFDEAAAVEGGMSARIAVEIFHTFAIIENVPVIGHLLGIAGNAAMKLEWVRLPAWALDWSMATGWAEDGLSRNVVELGWVVGAAYLLFRFYLLVWLIKQAARVRKADSNPALFPLVGFVAPLLAFLQITGHGSVNGYGWMFVGFVLAARFSNSAAGQSRTR